MTDPHQQQRRRDADAQSPDPGAVVVPTTFGEIGGQTVLDALEEIAATAGDEVDVTLDRYGFVGHEAADLAIKLECYATKYDRHTRRTQRRRVRTLTVTPVFALSAGEPTQFLGYDVRDSAIDDADLSQGFLNPLAKGVPAGTALRTLQARTCGTPLPRAVERDTRQRRWARQGKPTYQDTLTEVQPNTRGWQQSRE